MSERIELIIDGTPRARPRDRHGARIVKGRAVSFNYRPTKIRIGKNGKPTPESLAWSRAQEWYKRVADAIGPHKPASPWTGPVRMDVDVFFERPQRLLKKKSPEEPIWHTSKPDRDNLEKSITDALKEAGLYADDCLVCAGEVRKFWAAKGCGPGVIIVASRIPPQL
jgi:Holliday junction resolvase RusA-like endonuclease